MASKKQGIGWQSSYLIKDAVFGKFDRARNDIQWVALLITEFFLTLILVGAIVIYLDGRFNVIDFPFNLIIFAGISYIVFRLYSYTETYRKLKGTKKESSFKIFVYEFLIFLIIVGSTYVYQDPAINVLPAPWNIILFLAILAIPTYFYVNEKFVK